MSGFFNQYRLFTETSQTGASLERLNRRHYGLIDFQRTRITGRHVLDIASHDGRWSFAAVQAGAVRVTGIEARPHLVAAACANFHAYHVPPERWNFICADVFEILRDERLHVDTVLLFGFFYHTLRHMELIELLTLVEPSTIIVDTNVAPDKDALIRVHSEPTAQEGNAAGPRDQMIVGVPSKAAVAMMLAAAGYSVRELNWPAMLAGNTTGVEDYSAGSRTTFVAFKD